MKIKRIIAEGVFMNSYFKGKLQKNKNVLIATTGATGSAKSLQDLKICSDWYLYFFGEAFPIQNVCFSIAEVMQLLSSGKLRRGEIIILEEAGTSMGNLDFQNRISKLFTYVLQSFRTLQVNLIMNLPVLTMLNKSARQLIHMHTITCGIDFKTNTSKSQCFLHQLNQSSGKSYWKYPRVAIGSRKIKLQRLNFTLPPKDLVNVYEMKKIKFLSNMTYDFSTELNKIEFKKAQKTAGLNLTEREKQAYEYHVILGYTLIKTGELMGISNQRVSGLIKQAQNKIKLARNKANSLGESALQDVNANPTTI